MARTAEQRKKHAEYMRGYYKNPEALKKKRICDWKYQGLIGDYEEIYKRYMETTHCDKCKSLLTPQKLGGRQKNMEHNHDTGEFRGIMCATCNGRMIDKIKPINNTSGYKNIGFQKHKKLWFYKKNYNGKIKVWRRKDKIKILCIKFAHLILINYREKYPSLNNQHKKNQYTNIPP